MIAVHVIYCESMIECFRRGVREIIKETSSGGAASESLTRPREGSGTRRDFSEILVTTVVTMATVTEKMTTMI